VFKLFKSFLIISKILCIVALLAFNTANSFGQSSRNYLSFSGAVFDVLQNNKTDLEARIEYRLNSIDWTVKPFAGVMTNTNSAKHFYLGVFYEIPLTSFLSIIPSFAPGLYFNGYSKDLHNILEFRSQIEFMFNLKSGLKAGIGFSHISNASLGSLNPGVESLALTFQFPVF